MAAEPPENQPGDAADRRRHPRIPVASRILISHHSFGSMLVKTRDVSTGGVFLVFEHLPDLPPGTVIQGQIQDDLPDRPLVRMEVVRFEPNGIGLRFLD